MGGEEHSSLSSFISRRFGGLVNFIGRHILEFSAESLQTIRLQSQDIIINHRRLFFVVLHPCLTSVSSVSIINKHVIHFCQMPVGNFQPTPPPTSITSSSIVPTPISQGNCLATIFLLVAIQGLLLFKAVFKWGSVFYQKSISTGFVAYRCNLYVNRVSYL